MTTKLYVGKLPYSTTEDELRALFAQQGTVVSVAVIKDRETGQSKGFGFVEMEDEAQAQAAIKALDGSDVSGRSIMVSIARPQEPRPTNGGFGGNRGGSSRPGGFQRRY